MVTAAASSMAKLKAKVKGRSLRLYVAGNAPNSLLAIANAKAICGEHLHPPDHLEIIDLLKHPERALADGIIVTPTLIRLSPLPVGRVVGNLSDATQVLLLLGTP
jgi:circadian clock protein KaiB